MSILLLFAFLAGIVTILSPCILPMLPIILSGTVGKGKSRPLGIISGFIFSFSLFTLALSALVSALGINANFMRILAAVFILMFGLVMVVPWIKNRFLALVSGLTTRFSAKKPQDRQKSGYWSGVILGFSLGLVWTPCVGPIMASVISLALSQSVDAGSVLITVAYAAGTAVPMFLIMLGGRTLLQRFPFFLKNSEKIQKVFGVLMLATSLALFTGLDRKFQTWVLDVFPSYGSGLTRLEESSAVQKAIEARSHSGAEQISFTADNQTDPLSLYSGQWFNSPALLLNELKGRVVLVDFWTYSCINCIRTLPYLRAWQDTYADKGLVIIGVHSPEFAFEKDPANLKKAMKDLGVIWPVVQDNDFGIWNAFKNRYWPAHYLFDKDGKLVDTHFGEGKYAETEALIKKLLNDKSASVSKKVTAEAATVKSRSPETYLGYGRARGFASPEDPVTNEFADYSFPADLRKNFWALSGSWKITSEASMNKGKAKLRYQFEAADIYLVIRPGTADGGKVMVSVNGKAVNSAEVRDGILQLDSERLYHLYHSDKGESGILELEFLSDAAVYAFTFG